MVDKTLMLNWNPLVEELITGRPLSAAEGRELIESDLDELLFGANRLRQRIKGDRINLCSIVNAKSGACSENCRFCAQSAHHGTDVASYPLKSDNELCAAMDEAVSRGAGCFGVVASGRAPAAEEIDRLADLIGRLDGKAARFSVSLGEISDEALARLKAAGLKRFHHNLETAESFFPSICSTHTYQDRLTTARRIKKAGLELCCGGLFGLGESWAQRLEFALALQALAPDTVPLNFLNPVKGTPLENQPQLAPREILRIIALFRFALPFADIQVCGGREVNLRDLQSWIFFAGANGMMTGGYLTTGGRSPEQDRKMIEDLGLTTA